MQTDRESYTPTNRCTRASTRTRHTRASEDTDTDMNADTDRHKQTQPDTDRHRHTEPESPFSTNVRIPTDAPRAHSSRAHSSTVSTAHTRRIHSFPSLFSYFFSPLFSAIYDRKHCAHVIFLCFCPFCSPL